MPVHNPKTKRTEDIIIKNKDKNMPRNIPIITIIEMFFFCSKSNQKVRVLPIITLKLSNQLYKYVWSYIMMNQIYWIDSIKRKNKSNKRYYFYFCSSFYQLLCISAFVFLAYLYYFTLKLVFNFWLNYRNFYETQTWIGFSFHDDRDPIIFHHMWISHWHLHFSMKTFKRE